MKDNLMKFKQKSSTKCVGILLTITSIISVGGCTTMTATAGENPHSVIITVPVGQTSDAKLQNLIKKWSNSDTISNVLWLRSKGNPDEKFGELIAIDFSSNSAFSTWSKTEKPKISRGTAVRSAVILTHGEVTPRNTYSATFKINDYQPLVSAAKYDEFSDGYVRPLMEGQVAEKIMTRYTMYYEDGKNPTVWSIYEYKSDDALARAGKIKEGIRATLTQTNSTYRSFHPIKSGLRVGGLETYASSVSVK